MALRSDFEIKMGLNLARKRETSMVGTMAYGWEKRLVERKD
jgi:hypothetical protein